MASKKDISRLLKKGLTGWEAGIMAFESFWTESRGQEGVLSDRDLSDLKAGIRTEKDIQDWNAMMQLYRTAEYMEREAFTALLQAAVAMERAAGLGHIRLAPMAAEMMLARQPHIMTQKQFEEERQAIIDRQRQIKLQELHPLGQVLWLRMGLRAPDGWWQEWQESGSEMEEGLYLREKHPEAIPLGAQDILDLIQAGRLRPIQLSQEDRERMDSLEQQIQAGRDKKYPPGETQGELLKRAIEGKYPPGWSKDDDIRWQELFQEKEAFTREAYQKAGRDSQERLAWVVASLEQYRDGTHPPEEAGKLLDYTFCLGEELYQAGLPEWQENIDTYYEMLYEEDLDESSVAIIPKPKKWQLDERGHYKKPAFSWPLAPMLEEEKFSELYLGIAGLATEEIGRLLARREVLEEVSHYIGLALYEGLDISIQTLLKPAISRYNALAEAVSNARVDPKLFEAYGHTLIRWKRLKPPRRELNKMRQWISESLGEDWWKGVQDRHKEPRPLLGVPGSIRQSLQALQEEEAEDES